MYWNIHLFGIFNYARAGQQQIAPFGKVQDIIVEETVESMRGAPILVCSWKIHV